MPPQPLRKKILPGVCPARHERQQRFRPHRAILMIALTELFIHDAHEPSMTAASDILWKPACLSRQEAPTLTEGAGTCRPGNGDRNTSANRPETMKPWEKKTLRRTGKRPGREAGASSCSTEPPAREKHTGPELAASAERGSYDFLHGRLSGHEPGKT